MARPLQLFEVELVQQGPERGSQHEGVDPVGFEFGHHLEAGVLVGFVVVHQLLVGDADVVGGIEEGLHRGGHAVGLLEPNAGENALPARVIGGLGRVALFVGADHRAHAGAPNQVLHSATASIALTPKASAPV